MGICKKIIHPILLLRYKQNKSSLRGTKQSLSFSRLPING
jgi:hypothetical protein